MDISERLSLALGHLGITGAELARRVGMSKAGINDILRGRSKGGLTFGLLAAALDVDPLWLRDGTGQAPVWAPGTNSTDLQAENERLKAENERLKTENQAIKEDMLVLSRQMAAIQRGLMDQATNPDDPILVKTRRIMTPRMSRQLP